jgi:hypothetical protein
MYAILTRDGRVRGAGKSAGTLYKTIGGAQNQARTDGDTVIRVVLDLRAEPVFIRKRTL